MEHNLSELDFKGDYDVRENRLYQLLDDIAEYAKENHLAHLMDAVIKARSIARLEMHRDDGNVIPLSRGNQDSGGL